MANLSEEPAFIGDPSYSGRVEVFPCGLCDGWGRHEYGQCASCKGTGYLSRPTCHRCGNTKGGTPGNEQWVNGQLLCDYCDAEDMRAAT